MSLSIIAAVAQNMAIGNANRLLWHISEDLKYFKQITSGHTVIMGRKTFESIGKPLSNRTNIVLSKTMAVQKGVIVVRSFDEVASYCNNDVEIFVIGGGSLYREVLPLVNRLYITEVHANYEADTFFPAIDFSEWREISRRDFPHGEKFSITFSFVIYERCL